LLLPHNLEDSHSHFSNPCFVPTKQKHNHASVLAPIYFLYRILGMPTSLFATCSDGCGWAGAVIAPFAFGSFGVPLKTSVKVEVDPLVMQVCYMKSFCACCSHWTRIHSRITFLRYFIDVQDIGMLCYLLVSHFHG
jgi:hypothetical protein